MNDGTLTPFAEGVWVDTAPVRFLGMRLTATMTVLCLGDGSLLLYSPVAMTPERRPAARRSIDALLALPFDRLIVGHGAPLAAGGKEALAAAYAWLRPASG